MPEPEWKQYSARHSYIKEQAVRISKPGDVVERLVVRAKVQGSTWLFGDFSVGAKLATVCNLERAFSRVEKFEVGAAKLTSY